VRQAAVLRMTGVGFTYPGTDRQVLRDVNVRCNLNSRVAVLGVRGPSISPLSLLPWR
jgi:ABC-type transport system involved in cytochrome bd biosynthesis fused ATPase/permease subunit